jgi:enamine deaminase RidA (YjgF/YER057c/UK114 family)
MMYVSANEKAVSLNLRRYTVGVGSLPRGWAVEVEAIFELHDNL